MKKDAWITTGITFVAFLIRLPFVSRYLYHWDSVNYALSLEHYDVRLHQPHPPGYFLYSMLGKLVNLIFQDANTSLVVISLIFGSLGIGALYLLGRHLVNRQVGIVAALLGMFSPLLWYESEVALNYTADFFFVSVLGLLFVKQWQGNRSLWFWSAVLLAVTGGIRVHDIVFLGPLWLLALVRLNWKKRILSLVVFGIVVLAWFIPMAALSGGLRGYIDAFLAGSGQIASEASFLVFDQLGLNLFRLGIYLVYGLLASLIPLAWGAWKFVSKLRDGIHQPLFLPVLLWLLPSVLFFIFIHIRQAGHVILLLPVLFVLAGWAVVSWTKQFHARQPIFWLVGGLCLLNVVFFMAAPKALFGSNRLPLQTPSRASLVQRDIFLKEHIQFITEHLDPGSTAVIAGGLNVRHPDYYLRNYQQTDLSYRLTGEWVSLVENVNALVLFDDQIFPEFTSANLETQKLADGSTIRILRWNANQQLWVSLSGLEIREK